MKFYWLSTQRATKENARKFCKNKGKKSKLLNVTSNFEYKVARSIALERYHRGESG